MRILRTILVLTGITVFMPSPPDDSNKVVLAGNTADAGYFEVATNTYSDLAAFCERQPGVCETAGFVAHKLELKAKFGARLIYEWANEANPTPPTALQPDIAQGSDPIEQDQQSWLRPNRPLRLPNQRSAWKTSFRSGGVLASAKTS